jgi:hypothetical protein
MKQGRDEFVMVKSMRQLWISGNCGMNCARNLAGFLDTTKCFLLELMYDLWQPELMVG